MLLRLSRLHGLNVTVDTCFWCGETTNTLVLCGRLPGDAQAPMGYEPCESCREQWAKGIVLLEANKTPYHAQQPAMGDAYPTGRYAVVTVASLSGFLSSQEMVLQIAKARKAFLYPEAFNKLFSPTPASELPATATAQM